MLSLDCHPMETIFSIWYDHDGNIVHGGSAELEVLRSPSPPLLLFCCLCSFDILFKLQCNRKRYLRRLVGHDNSQSACAAHLSQ